MTYFHRQEVVQDKESIRFERMELKTNRHSVTGRKEESAIRSPGQTEASCFSQSKRRKIGYYNEEFDPGSG